jgi:hypothetical protein
MNLAATGEVKMNPDHDPHDEARYQGRCSQIWLQQEVIHYECEGILGTYHEGFLPTCAGQTNTWKGRFLPLGYNTHVLKKELVISASKERQLFSARLVCIFGEVGLM